MTEFGTAVVVSLGSAGVKFQDTIGSVREVSWSELTAIRAITDGEVPMLSELLRPIWDTLDADAQNIALSRLEVVQEILTGYREGHPELARPGEPRAPFGPGFGVSESRRCKAMAAALSEEGQADRVLQRRVRDGDLQSSGTSPSTVAKWVRDWRKGGLLALIDGRTLRGSKGWDLIDPLYQAAARAVMNTLDGDRSTVSNAEIDRRARVRLLEEGVRDPVTPQRMTAAFLSSLKSEKGATTRSQKTHALGKVSGKQHFPGSTDVSVGGVGAE